MKRSKYFYDSIFPTVLVSMILGLNPIFIKNHGSERILYTNKYLYAINLTYLTVYTFLVIKTINDAKNSVMSNKYYGQNKVSNIGIGFVFMGGIIYVILIYIFGSLKSRSIKMTLERIYKVDQILDKFGQNLYYKRTIIYQLITILSAYLLICFNTAMQYQNMTKEKFRAFSTTTWIVFITPAFVANTFESQFAHTVLLVYQRFKMINEQLRNLGIQQPNRDFDIKGFSPARLGIKANELKVSIISEKIKILMKMHDQLCDISKVINQNYVVQEIVLLIFQYGTLLFSLFYTYWMFSTKPFSATCWLLWSTLKASEVLHITISCHLASKEARATGAAVHKLLIPPPRETEVQKKLMAFSNQLMHRKVRFTIWGIFTLDATLLFTSIGAAATYMAIMLQFQQASLPMTCKTNIAVNTSTLAPIH